MAADTLAEKLDARLRLSATKTVGEDRIKKARDNDEDVAVLSTFMPDVNKEGFHCALDKLCRLGDPKNNATGTPPLSRPSNTVL
ncbi:hypothetical protein PR048_010955 [Dryococelus australis]|uniref:Uncharacterized protein n=1 Tax=Dryococelus australis TaxID=614101 RepID=A0ABQ9HKB1_9NEOP|nr:hypothetical protein PR048_010955 [Dryococelus australis]